MKKLFIIPILIALAFSQLQSKQSSYIIYTDGKVYNNVVLHSVQGSYLLFNENNSTKKNRIPIINAIIIMISTNIITDKIWL